MRVVRLGAGLYGHELEAHVDDVAARRVTVGGLDVYAHDHARDRCVHIGHVEVGGALAGKGRDLLDGAVLQRGAGPHEVRLGELARQVGAAGVAQAPYAVAVADVAVAVRQGHDEVVAKGLMVGLGRRPGVAQDGQGLLVLGALRGERGVVGEKPREDEGARALYCLAQIHVAALCRSWRWPSTLPERPLKLGTCSFLRKLGTGWRGPAGADGRTRAGGAYAEKTRPSRRAGGSGF